MMYIVDKRNVLHLNLSYSIKVGLSRDSAKGRKIVDLRMKIAPERTYSTDGSDRSKLVNLKNCTLIQLTHEMDRINKLASFSDVEDFSLDESTLLDIKKAVLSRKFKFTALNLTFLDKDQFVFSDKKRKSIPGLPKDAISFYVDPKEKLVMLALGVLLDKTFNECALFHFSSFAYRINLSLTDFFRTVGYWSNVELLMVANLSPSKLSHSHLLHKLSTVVKDRAIIDLLISFIDMSIFDKMGNDWATKKGLPPIPLLSDVLFNFYLDDLDRSFEVHFPFLKYARYNSHILIPMCLGQSTTHFIQNFKKLLHTLRLQYKLICARWLCY